MSLKRLVDVGTVAQLLKKNIINKEGVRILDCAYDSSQIKKKPDWKHYKKELYGDFKRILARPCPSKEMYLSGHIPLAPHFCIDAAFYPSEHVRYDLYPPEIFQNYMQLLGINPDEHLILYSHSRFGAMIYAMKVAWLLKSYGHDKVSVIDGGLQEWKKKGYEISKEDVKLELNLLDSRVRGQYEGTASGDFPPNVIGTFIPGFKNLPAAELVDGDHLRNPDNLKDCKCNGTYIICILFQTL
ncbi:unnamed protein product [Cylicostephanus goldi]|uniref:Rhodanese domain-containing protein n=1 Tax=Cylicostephanus goldi TaxID=71465 RepID=A0A3P7LY87_CYLGO|nr:unnamed protein product [Cylicostephanus goldi]